MSVPLPSSLSATSSTTLPTTGPTTNVENVENVQVIGTGPNRKRPNEETKTDDDESVMATQVLVSSENEFHEMVFKRARHINEVLKDWATVEPEREKKTQEPVCGGKWAERVKLFQRIQAIKNLFPILAEKLNLTVVDAPRLMESSSGLNDDLNGVEVPVYVQMPLVPGQTSALPGDEKKLQFTVSSAKWKSLVIRLWGVPTGQGILALMQALRPEETVDATHSQVVNQWDICQRIEPIDVIGPQNVYRQVLEPTIQKICASVSGMADEFGRQFKEKMYHVPLVVKIIHSEDLLQLYPGLTPKEREQKYCEDMNPMLASDGIASTFVAILGIGAKLSDGKPHDTRAPDYDNSTSLTYDPADFPGKVGYKGWNYDLFFPNGVEFMSGGVRVNGTPEILKAQLIEQKVEHRLDLPYHQLIMRKKMYQTQGGGIGIDRIVQYFLKKNHISEILATPMPSAYYTSLVDKKISPIDVDMTSVFNQLISE